MSPAWALAVIWAALLTASLTAWAWLVIFDSWQRRRDDRARAITRHPVSARPRRAPEDDPDQLAAIAERARRMAP